MKLFNSFLLTLLLPICLIAQQKNPLDQLHAQLKKVLAGAASDFKSFRGTQVKEEKGDVIYTSVMTLQGTTNNQVMAFTSGSSYMARLGKTTDAVQAQAILETWKKKVLAIAGSSYEVMKDDHTSEAMDQKGYLLLSDKLSISIHTIKYTDEETINAFLLIMRL